MYMPKEWFISPDPHNDNPRAEYVIMYRTEDAGECRIDTTKDMVMALVATLVQAGADVYYVMARN